MSIADSRYPAVADLDRFLGDPRQPGTPFSYRDIVECEEESGFPDGISEMVRKSRFYDFLVPAEHGGRLRSLEELFLLTRAVSQRNVGVSVMLGSTFLGGLPTWIWGSDEQKEIFAREILGGNPTSMAISEAAHGSDVNANEAVARREGTDLVLTGSKWPAGNATKARLVTVYARTGEGAIFSMIVVDKEQLAPDSWVNLPLVKMVGLRGHDVSGITFDGSRVPDSAIIGPEGTGLGQSLKFLQITRALVPALSLGTMDATVRIALTYAQDRHLYGRAIYMLPVIRDQLLKAHLDVLISECVTTPVSRSLSIAPGRLSLWSALVKYFVPVVAEEVVASMSSVLGARGYLREGAADGAFQKLQRDHAIASVFEGTTHVNLNTVTHQLPFILADNVRRPAEPERAELLSALFSLTEEAPTWTPDALRLQLTNEGQDEITHSWEQIKRQLEELDPSAVHRDLRKLVAELGLMRERCYARLTHGGAYDNRSARAMAVAKEHCVFHAAASCLLTWLCNREALDGAFADGHWLVLCLHRLIQRLDLGRELPEEYLAVMEESVLHSLHEDTPFTLAELARS